MFERKLRGMDGQWVMGNGQWARRVAGVGVGEIYIYSDPFFSGGGWFKREKREQEGQRFWDRDLELVVSNWRNHLMFAGILSSAGPTGAYTSLWMWQIKRVLGAGVLPGEHEGAWQG